MRCTGKSYATGFTLIELLAAVVLVLLMAGLLIPAVGRMASRSDVVRCMNNVRQLAFAAQVYASDNNELWPANGNWDASLNLASPPADYTARIWAEGRQVSNWTTQEEVDGMVSEKVSLLAKYVEDKRAFRCPTDRAPTRIGARQLLRARDYGLNNFVGWTPDRQTPATYHGEPNSSSQVFGKTGDAERPAELFMFGEVHPFSICHPMFGTHPRWDATGNPTGQNLTFHVPANFHRGATMFSMMDGRGELRRWRNPRFNDPRDAKGRPSSEWESFWHTHETPLPGVRAAEVETDFKWLTARATVPR
jgi:type II secretory pathway pseudopilin PulG